MDWSDEIRFSDGRKTWKVLWWVSVVYVACLCHKNTGYRVPVYGSRLHTAVHQVTRQYIGESTATVCM
jgi:hypothetical protein